MACQVNKFYISTVLTSIRLVHYVLVMIRVLCCVATSAGWDREEEQPKVKDLPLRQL